MSRSSPRRRAGFAPALVIVVLALVLWFLFARSQPVAENSSVSGMAVAESVSSSSGETQPPAALAAIAQTATPMGAPEGSLRASTPTRGPPDEVDGLPVIFQENLPPEALDTLALIESAGPFPFSKDGTIFQNREQMLPRKPRGYYREFTVITPDENDRGARRIVAGDGGELYYTDDHYVSFARIWIP